MKTNVGLADRVIRMYAGMVIAGSFIFYNSAWAMVGIPLFVVGAVGFCPLYSMLKINTLEKESSG